MTANLPAQFYSSDVLASFALVAILLAVRLLAGRALKKRQSLPPQAVRRWTANVRNLLLLIAVIGLVMIWAPQLRTFALSLTAVAVALVVATKELILCLSGSALRTFTRAYTVGDYVQIGGIRGEVIDYNLLTTRLHEFEKGEGSFIATGHEVIVPHSLLFGSPSRVEGQAGGGRVPHAFQLTFDPKVNLFAEREAIESAASEAQVRYEAERQEAPHGRKGKQVKRPSPPKVQIGLATSEIGKYRLDLTVLALPELVEQTQNAVTCAIGNYVHRMGGAECEGGAAAT